MGIYICVLQPAPVNSTMGKYNGISCVRQKQLQQQEKEKSK